MAFKYNEKVEFKHYAGLAIAKLVAVNPTATELAKFRNNEVGKEPVYIGEDTNGVKRIQIDLWFQTTPSLNDNIDTLIKATYFISNEANVGSKSGKIQAIDKYGTIIWMMPEEYEAKTKPNYVKGVFDMDSMRKTFKGEEDLTKAIRVLLNIPLYSFVKPDGNIKLNDNPENCLCRLDDIEKYFNGNVEEIKSLAKMAANNEVKLAVGIKDNKYETVFKERIFRSNYVDFAAIAKEINDRQAAGAYSNTIFSFEPLHEFRGVQATELTSKINDTPFASANEGIPTTEGNDLLEDKDLPF